MSSETLSVKGNTVIRKHAFSTEITRLSINIRYLHDMGHERLLLIIKEHVVRAVLRMLLMLIENCQLKMMRNYEGEVESFFTSYCQEGLWLPIVYSPRTRSERLSRSRTRKNLESSTIISAARGREL